MNMAMRQLARPSMQREPAPPGNSFTRFLTAHAKSYLHRSRAPFEIAEEMYPGDDALMQMLVTRAPTTPATIGNAAALTQTFLADMFAAMAPVSASAAIFQQSLSVTFDRNAAISVPVFSGGGPGMYTAFVAEGGPIPVGQGNTAAARLDPHKMAAIWILTREMIEHSNAERLITDAAIRALGVRLDGALFDANPAGPLRPAGLRFNVPPTNRMSGTPGTPGTTPEVDWVFADMSVLAGAVAPVAGNLPIIFIAAPDRALRMALRAGPARLDRVIILASNAVINDLLCIAPNALVVAASGEPEIEMSELPAVQMDSAAAGDLLSLPVTSVWQTDSVAMKLRWPVSWVARDPRAFAWIDGTSPPGAIPW